MQILSQHQTSCAFEHIRSGNISIQWRTSRLAPHRDALLFRLTNLIYCRSVLAQLDRATISNKYICGRILRWGLRMKYRCWAFWSAFRPLWALTKITRRFFEYTFLSTSSLMPKEGLTNVQRIVSGTIRWRRYVDALSGFRKKRRPNWCSKSSDLWKLPSMRPYRWGVWLYWHTGPGRYMEIV